MKREIIHSEEVPGSPLYSHAVKVGNTVFLSGIVGFNPRTKKVDAPTIEEQTDLAIRNCKSILRAAHASLDDVVQVTILLREPSHFERMNAAYSKHFPKDPPARAVAKLGVDFPQLLVSIMMTAIVPDESSREPKEAVS
jgi:2-iminobutanoate/2-iminopropanoate deaminase